MTDDIERPDVVHRQQAIDQPYATEHVRLVLSVDAEPEDAPGEYRVVFVLGRPGVGAVLWDNLDISALETGGDSLVSIGQASIKINGPDGHTWDIYADDDGRLSRVEITLRAQNLTLAEHNAHNLVTPLLSALAFEANVGIEVQATLATSLATGEKSFQATVGGRGCQVESFIFGLTPQSRNTLLSIVMG